MKSDIAKKIDFRDKLLPDLEVLLQFSLWLTKNGRDAIRLLREGLAEAYQTWDSSTDERCYLRLHGILARRFAVNFQKSIPDEDSNGRFKTIADGSSHLCSVDTDACVNLDFQNAHLDTDVTYLKLIATLPPEFRSVMILSYMEGFSNQEIAKLAGIAPTMVESVLGRGRRFLQQELFVSLMGELEYGSNKQRLSATT